MFTGCGDGKVRAYSARDGVLKRVFAGHESAVNAMIIVGDKMYTGASDSTIRCWNVKELW